MAKTNASIGAEAWTGKPRQRRRSKPVHLRGRKTLGPKSCMRGKK